MNSKFHNPFLIQPYCKLFLFCIFIISSIRATSQVANGCDTSFHSIIKSDSSNYAYDIIRTNDGGYAIAGKLDEASNSFPILTKLNSLGSVQWMKSFTTNYYEGAFTKIVATNDGAFLVMGQQRYYGNNKISDSMHIMKVADSGKVIWSRNYAQYTNTIGWEMAEAANGDIILYFADTQPKTFLMRLNSQGDIVWKRNINNPNSSSFSKIYLDNDDLYITGKVGGSVNNNSYGPFLARYNAQTGKLLWANFFYENSETLIPLFITKIRDTVNLVIEDQGITDNYPAQNKIAVIKISADGKLLSASEINKMYISHQYDFSYNNNAERYIEKTADNNFVLSHQVRINDQSVFNITKFTPDCNILWSRNYTGLPGYYPFAIKSIGDGTLVTGQKLIEASNNKYTLQTFIIRTDKNGYIIPGEQGSVCSATDNILLMSEVYNVNLAHYPLPASTSNDIIKYSDYIPLSGDLAYSVIPYCATQTGCSSFQLTGSDTVCKNNLSDTIKLERNKECTAPAIWIQKEDYTIISYTDTTAVLQFNRNGNISIEANIYANCSIQTISKNIYVTQPANTLDLGPDGVICAGNNLILHAGKDFYSYLWHDGSTDSVYTAQSAGLYYVRVTDICGNSYSDTINIINAGILNFSAGSDTTICLGDTLNITATSGFTNYQWTPVYNIINETSQPSVKLFPATDTFYMVTADKGSGCIMRDTIHIKVKQPLPFTLGNDTTFCEGKLLTLYAPSGYTEYMWNNGSSNPQINVITTGNYYLKARDINGCFSSDTIAVLINKNPIIDLGADKNICPGQGALLDAGSGFNKYVWQDGTTASAYTANVPGGYSVSVTGLNGCTAADTIQLTGYFTLPSGFLSETDSICTNEHMQLTAQGNWVGYKWSNGSITPATNINAPGIYSLQVTDMNGCKGVDTIQVFTKQCATGIFFPSGFTPNADGKNDLFKPIVKTPLDNYHLVVFNRLGQKIFETNDPLKGWDGHFNNVAQPANAAYVWYCQYKIPGNDAQILKGTVLLLR